MHTILDFQPFMIQTYRPGRMSRYELVLLAFSKTQPQVLTLRKLQIALLTLSKKQIALLILSKIQVTLPTLCTHPLNVLILSIKQPLLLTLSTRRQFSPHLIHETVSLSLGVWHHHKCVTIITSVILPSMSFHIGWVNVTVCIDVAWNRFKTQQLDVKRHHPVNSIQQGPSPAGTKTSQA